MVFTACRDLWIVGFLFSFNALLIENENVQFLLFREFLSVVLDFFYF